MKSTLWPFGAIFNDVGVNFNSIVVWASFERRDQSTASFFWLVVTSMFFAGW